MLFKFITILVTVPLIFGQFQKPLDLYGRKVGSCPPYPNVGICEMSCYMDFHCPGLQKCCRTACGGTFCLNPVTEIRLDDLEKPGSCPNPPKGPWVCSNRCGQDSDCRGKKKCCRNRCGAMACVTPEENENEILF
ncbi:hypothetical protein NQ315_002934 [Exocentrus adspersus]|uniref:WAP domain-containing protein n=1 Tax=Exocentrus adspersus TaxID=1586481 RepID=A0AAV8W5L3_9CUCU|nr:hypothetical protein NQ315_002934 [Exocentrus adspersus]